MALAAGAPKVAALAAGAPKAAALAGAAKEAAALAGAPKAAAALAAGAPKEAALQLLACGVCPAAQTGSSDPICLSWMALAEATRRVTANDFILEIVK